MSLHFIIGRAGSGKTAHVSRCIRDELRRSADGNPLIWIVPEQGTFQVEHTFVSEPSMAGMIRAQVLSFRRLAYRVMQEIGGMALTIIDEEGKKMLLYKILQKYKSDLSLFTNSAEQFGFIEKLNHLFDEMKRYRIESSDIEKCCAFYKCRVAEQPLLSAKLKDISIIFHEFEAALANHYLDSEAVLQRLAEGIIKSDYVKNATIWIDGFHSFTPQEYVVLASLIVHAADVSVTFCLDRAYNRGELPQELDLFYSSAMVMVKLREMAHILGVKMGTVTQLEAQGEDHSSRSRYRFSPRLAHLERYFAEKVPYSPQSVQGADFRTKNVGDLIDDGSISVHAAVHRCAEVTAVARDILDNVRKKGIRWRDVIVMVRHIAHYGEWIENVFAEAGIPYFIDQKRSVLHHPLIEMTRAAIEIGIGNWKYDAVFRFIKTDFIWKSQDEVTRTHFDKLENYVLACGIEGTMWTNDRCWPTAPEFFTPPICAGMEIEHAQMATEVLQSGQAPPWAETCRMMLIQPLTKLIEAMKASHNVRGMCEALYRFWMDLEVPHKLEEMSRGALLTGDVRSSREHRKVWGALLDVLDQMVELVGDEVMNMESFSNMLDTGLQSIQLALIPPALDQVLVASIERTRPGHVKHLYMLGVNDGIIPARPMEEGILTEMERETLQQLGMNLAPGAYRQLLDERFLIYRTLTMPSQSLWISYALADEEGKSLFPSEVIRHVRSMFPDMQEQLITDEPNAFMSDEKQADFAAYPQLALKHFIVQLRQWKQGHPIAHLWWDVYRWLATQPTWSNRLQTLVGSLLYDNKAKALTPVTSQQLYGSTLRTSVSQMERFTACPFSHFASYGLKLKERQIYRWEAPHVGQLFHAALSHWAMTVQKEKRSWATLSEDECKAEAARSIDLLASRLQGAILLSSKRYQHFTQKLKQVIGRVIFVLREHARRGSFMPIGLEMDFGVNKPLPPLQFTLNNGCTMEISGRIDRIDRADSNKGVWLRVIDYKSSAMDLKLPEVYYGLSLQMFIYVDVLMTHAEKWLGQAALPAGTLYFHVHNPLLQAANGMNAERVYKQMMKKYTLRGLILADHEVVSLMDDQLEKGYSDIVPVAIKTDGTFYSKASVSTMEQWNLLRDKVRRMMWDIGTRVTNGDVQIAPYRMGKKTACRLCKFKPVCQFDQLMTGNTYRMLPRIRKDEVWAKIKEETAASC